MIRNRRLLGVSWLNDEFSASWCGAGGGRVTWTSPTKVTDGATLRAALVEVVRRSAGKGQQVRFVIEQRNVMFHVQETPPARGRVVDQVLNRLIAENRFFDEPAVWARLSLPAALNRHRWLLTMMPRSVWSEVESACYDCGLILEGLFPVAAVMAGSLGRIEIEADEPVLVVADLGGSHGLLVGRGQGQVLFARSISDTGTTSRMRLEQEINRTLHFVQQRFGVAVNRLVAMGTGCYAELAGRKLRDGLKVECLLNESDSAAFAAAAVEIQDRISLNFVHGRRRLPGWVRPSLVAGMAMLLAVSVSAALVVERETRLRDGEVQRLTREKRAAAEIAANRDSRKREGEHHTAVKRLIRLPDEPPVAATFLKYLQTSVPDGLRLTALSLSKSTNGWSLRMEGVTREQGSRQLAIMEDFESELGEGVFKVKVSDSTHRRATARSVLQAGPRAGGDMDRGGGAAGERPFFLAGLIQ